MSVLFQSVPLPTNSGKVPKSTLAITFAPPNKNSQPRARHDPSDGIFARIGVETDGPPADPQDPPAN
jgi:hypothetical protein